MEGIHISLKPEVIGHMGNIPITNTLLMSWIVVLVLAFFGSMIGRRVALVPKKVQVAVELLFTSVLTYIEETLEDKKLARKFFPLLMTIFLFIFTANALEFTPGIGSLGFFHGVDEFTPLLRSMNTDFNMTLALAIISFFVIEVTGVAVLGFLKYFKKFVNVSSVMGFLVGIMELLSEVARLISFSFRLFGNIFAGEVLIMVAMAFLPGLLPVPLMVFEVFVGFIQAAVFALLTLFFVKIAVTEAH